MGESLSERLIWMAVYNGGCGDKVWCQEEEASAAAGCSCRGVAVCSELC